jgi:hypothetical protein
LNKSNKNKPTIKESINNLENILVLQRHDGDTLQAKLTEKIIKRLKSLELEQKNKNNK